MTGVRQPFPAIVGATGVVFGDIGTSPLYALEESIAATGSGGDAVVLGVLSLILWSLFVSVTLKYVVVVMRADNEGEGGILALFALAQRGLAHLGRWRNTLVGLALAGTALFYCDALITPAISVLSAVEGVELLDPSLERAAVPITLVVLALLFAVQRRGTAHVARVFGPVMVLWFLAIGASGAAAVLHEPAVLAAFAPQNGLELLRSHPGVALTIIGAVFLALTGGEALYADMGHFGSRPVRTAWFVLVWPALVLNYLGQGALLLGTRGPVVHPLYTLVPAELLPFMLVLATGATVIASQAVISGAFSVTRQAMQLDLLPRLRVLQTSAQEQGQIYVPAANLLLFLAVIAFVLGFGSSSALAGAYGAAVVGAMLVTTLLGAFVAITQWGWPKTAVIGLFGLFLVTDLVFTVGNLTKIQHGGWVPLALALGLYSIFSTWRTGRARLRATLTARAQPLSSLGQILRGVQRVPGTGIFLVSHPDFVPSALIRNIEHNHVAHERIVILHMIFVRRPRQDSAARVRIEQLLPDVHRVTACYGFMEAPDVGEVLRACRRHGLALHLEDCSFFLGWHLVRALERPGWGGLQRRLFAWMQRRSTQAAEFFRMPSRRVVVLGTEIEL
ncbi:MAG: KUP/HAK/KT family potassium transporter [Gammaproteobacteria bacterium]|nr:KUP/HAK/KT family potassium transporter [Gammaproteobacteria bacterium]